MATINHYDYLVRQATPVDFPVCDVCASPEIGVLIEANSKIDRNFIGLDLSLLICPSCGVYYAMQTYQYESVTRLSFLETLLFWEGEEKEKIRTRHAVRVVKEAAGCLGNRPSKTAEVYVEDLQQAEGEIAAICTVRVIT